MIVIEPPSSGSGDPAFKAVRKPELNRFLKQAQRTLGLRGEVTLLLADDHRIRELNRGFRGKNKTTDVLSFPAGDHAEGVIGDLAISVPVAAAQASAHGHTLAEELRILTLHGLLHLAGFDHETDKGEMRTREAELREQFALPVSLIERALAATEGSRTKQMSLSAAKQASLSEKAQKLATTSRDGANAPCKTAVTGKIKKPLRTITKASA